MSAAPPSEALRPPEARSFAKRGIGVMGYWGMDVLRQNAAFNHYPNTPLPRFFAAIAMIP
jgi:hypothetical protein